LSVAPASGWFASIVTWSPSTPTTVISRVPAFVFAWNCMPGWMSATPWNAARGTGWTIRSSRCPYAWSGGICTLS
jgi:hypothetical protein